MSNDRIKLYKLNDIAGWQLKQKAEVGLPILQRNFVWRSHQIENLWDSIFRDYPTGSFLMSSSPKEEGNYKYDLLDGQQRATSIAIGFYNPWNTANLDQFWRLENVPLLWFDLSSLLESNTSDRQFIFKISTRSHPWGYQTSKNTKVLTTTDIQKALNSYKIKDDKNYFEINDLKQFWPWDAKLPVPLPIIFDAFEKLGTEDYSPKWVIPIKKFLEKNNLITTKHLVSNESYSSLASKILDDEKISERLFEIVKSVFQREIPALLVPNNYMKEGHEKDVLEDESTSKELDSLNLFIRVNSAGTPLSGEELIYSIYKAHFPESQNLIENAETAKYIRPSRVLNYAIRLVEAKLQDIKSLEKTIPAKLKVKDFKKRIIQNEKFSSELKNLIHSLKTENIFDKAKKLLVGEFPFQIPYASLANIADESPDAFFILLYRLYKGDKIERGGEQHRKVIGLITSIAWFGKKERSSSNDGVLRLIWKDVIEKSQNEFWSSSVVVSALRPVSNKTKLRFLLPPKLIRDFLVNLSASYSFDELSSLDSKIGDERDKILNPLRRIYTGENGVEFYTWGRFLRSLKDQRNLILYGQRFFLDKWFKDVLTSGLEDVNKPWDWDHIYPSSYVSNIRKKEEAIAISKLTGWHSSTGNFRAWPYELNRSDSDESPATKLNPDLSNSVTAKYLASTDAFSASAIKDSQKKIWQSIKSRSKTKEEITIVHQAILNRMCDLYEEWYRELRLGELFGGIREEKINVKELVFKIQTSLPNYLITNEKDDDYLFHISPKKQSSAIKNKLFYYVVIEKRSFFESDDNNGEIGLWVNTGNEKESIRLMSEAVGYNKEIYGDDYQTTDGIGAVICKTTPFLNNAEALIEELENFMDETIPIFNTLEKKMV